MLQFISNIWNSDSLSPHGICLLWRPELIWTHAVSDALIGLSYLSISLFLAYLLSRRPDIKFGWVVWCFSVFILACGGTHFLSILTLWSPDYGLEAMVKVVTAIASVVTAIVLWPLLPAAIAWPSPEKLSLANAALTAALVERDNAISMMRAEMLERQKIETVLARAQKLDSLGHLAGGLAHDFNNILTIVTMNLARASRKLGDHIAIEVKQALDNAMDAAARAAGITNRMLAFSRQAPMSIKSTDIVRAIEDMVPLMRDALGLRRLKIDLPPDLPPVALDRNQFDNAMLNLILNARDATSEGGQVTVRVKATRIAQSGLISIEVADDGVGIPSDVVEHIFDPFFTTKPVGKGSGLGLSQVFGFARHLGGKVEVDSRPGSGTCVVIALPVAV